MQSLKRYCCRNYGSLIEIPMNVTKVSSKGLMNPSCPYNGIDETTLSPFSSDHLCPGFGATP